MPKQRAAVQAVFFEMDGTLTTLQAPAQELAAAGAERMTRWLQAQGLTLPDDFATQWLAARRFAAEKARQEQEEHTADDTLAFLLQFHGYAGAARELVRQAVDEFFQPECAHRVLLPGAKETLQALRAHGYRLGIIANTSCDRLIQREIERLGLGPYFQIVVTSAALEWRKPRPELFQHALDQLDTLGYEAVMVGNHLETDIKGAQEAQMWAIWADIVPVPENEALQETVTPDAVIHDLPALLPIIERWSTEWSWSYASGDEEAPPLEA